MKIAFYLVIAVIFFSCAKTEKITSEEVAAAIRRFDHAWRIKSATGVDSVLAGQYTYFTQSGGVFGRANVVNTAGSPEYVLDETERELISVVLHGNTAVVNSTWKGKGSYYGKPFDDYQRCSITLIKEGGEVKILSEHCTPIN